MREIVFRGKSKGKPEWVYGSLYKEVPQVFILVGGRFYPEPSNGQSALGIMDWYEVFPDSIGQFTGLTDKNGKKVFEGDIVAFTAEDELWEPHYYQGLVYFCDGTFWVDCGKDNDDNDVLFSIGHALLADKNIQVIGNIHDNPELLT